MKTIHCIFANDSAHVVKPDIETSIRLALQAEIENAQIVQEYAEKYNCSKEVA